MPMKNPPHPGIGLKDDIEELGLSVAEAAKGLGVTRQQLYNVINGKSVVTPEMAIRLEKAIGGSGVPPPPPPGGGGGPRKDAPGGGAGGEGGHCRTSAIPLPSAFPLKGGR